MKDQEVTTESNVHPCNMRFRSDLVPYTVIVVIEIVFNLLIFVAIVVSRKKLKHNHVYMYVGSVVTANLAMSVLFTYTLFNFLIAFERPDRRYGNDTHRFHPDQPDHQAVMIWWAIRKSIMVGLFLIMSGNVSALIYGVANSAYFVGRSGDSHTKPRFKIKTSTASTTGDSPLRSSTKKRHSVQITKKRRTFMVIGATWAFPLLYTLPTVFGWNCVKHCDCLPGYYGGYQCVADDDPALCSNIWTPMTQMHMLTAAIIWFIQLIVIAFSLFYALDKYYRTTRSSRSQEDEGVAEVTADIHPDVRRSKRATNEHENRLRSIKYRRPLHPTVKLLIGSSIAYTVTTGPMVICIVIDVASSIAYGVTAVSDMAMTAVSSLVVFYCFVCPLLLITFMPGLRRAVIRLLMPCTCTSAKLSTRTLATTRVSSTRT